MIRFAAILCIATAMLFGAEGLNAATFTVTKTADTNDGTCDADCSLREAVAAANAAAGDDIIRFALPLFSTPQTITLSGTEIMFGTNGSTTVYGTGANRLTISGNNASRIFSSNGNVVANLHHMRLTGGNGAGSLNTGRGGALYNVGGTMVVTNVVFTGNSAANGGAINNAATAGGIDATLTLVNCVLSNNSSTSSGAAMQNFSTSFLNVFNTTVNNNNSTGTGIAGAFQANGTVTITNSTFSGNTSSGTGAGVYFNGSSLIMTNTTIVNNTSPLGGGGLHRTGTAATANVRNTIIGGNTGAAATPDVSGTITSQGNNLIGNIGTSVGWLMSDLQNMNPLVSPVGFYGGVGMTHALLSGSPALNAGQNCVIDRTCSAANPPAAVTTDERGAARVGTIDIGAFEDNAEYFADLPSALIDTSYNQVLTPAVGAFTYSLANGTLPPGVTVNTGAVVASVSGTPTALGTYSFGVSITNGANSATVNYVLRVLTNLSVFPVTGRVVRVDGSPIPNATVVFTDRNNVSRTAITNPFGYFTFPDLQAGETYTVTVSAKGFGFPTQTVTVTDAISSMVIREVLIMSVK